MASSSVSQDDIDNDFEKNSRRSRIRTARARQFNPGNCRAEGTLVSANIGADDPEEMRCLSMALETSIEHDTSPKPMVRSGGGNGGCGKDKRPTKFPHVNKGKQQRDRRKLREKRRSTGVVHLASTESTGGSTTGDEEESSDVYCATLPPAAASGCPSTVAAETKRNTAQNESLATLYLDKDTSSPSMTPTNGKSHVHVGHTAAVGHLKPTSNGDTRSSHRRDKSLSDLEADDEHDLDSLNHSESGGSCCNLFADHKFGGLSSAASQLPWSGRPGKVDHTDDVTKVLEENRRLASLVEEKERHINKLECRLQQLMSDSISITEEQFRLQRENSTLLRALAKLSSDPKPQTPKS